MILSLLTFKARQCSTLSFPGSVISENVFLRESEKAKSSARIIGKVFLLDSSGPPALSCPLPRCEDEQTIDVLLWRSPEDFSFLQVIQYHDAHNCWKCFIFSH